MEYKPTISDSIHKTAERMVVLAMQNDTEVWADFNDVHLVALPETDPSEIVSYYRGAPNRQRQLQKAQQDLCGATDMSESKWAMPCPDCGKRIEWQGEFRERPACSHDATATVVDDDLMPPEAIARIEQCKRILDSVPNLPDRAEDFGLSVCEQVDSIREWIEANKHCTDALGNALDNVEQVVQKWLD